MGLKEDSLTEYIVKQPGRGDSLNKVTEAWNGITYLFLELQEALYGCNIDLKTLVTEDGTRS